MGVTVPASYARSHRLIAIRSQVSSSIASKYSEMTKSLPHTVQRNVTAFQQNITFNSPLQVLQFIRVCSSVFLRVIKFHALLYHREYEHALFVP